MSDFVVLDEDTARKLAELMRNEQYTDKGQDKRGQSARDVGQGPAAPNQMAQCTSATQNANGYYPGQRVVWDEPSKTWVQQYFCWINFPAASVPVANAVYDCKLTNVHSDGYGVFSSDKAGATGWTGTFAKAFVTAMSCANNNLSVTTQTLTIQVQNGDIIAPITLV